MKKEDIVKGVNAQLNGEMINFTDLTIHLNAVIGDINDALSSIYPNFTEVELLPGYDGNYTLFPDHYIRTVLFPGAAYKYYLAEEEGENVASSLYGTYAMALFIMKRDYGPIVPTIFQMSAGGVMDMGWTPTTEVSESAAFEALFGSSIPSNFVAIPGQRGPRGFGGPQGLTGKSAYEYALQGGYVGSEAQFIVALVSLLQAYTV
jgi:hypothetical protein